MPEAQGLETSIPANNQKIIEIYNKLRSGQLSVNKDYQRKLVWKKTHKVNFIDTILHNFPFPEIYLAPGALDQEKLILIDEIVDGQQRLTTIRDYIEGTDVFALPNLPILKFAEMSQEQRRTFLNYEVSVRYLKNVEADQVREIFQRINKTDYALNSTERVNAQWGSSEFVCFAKQLIEPDFESEGVQFAMQPNTRKEFVDFFHGGGDDENDVGVFSDTDMSRMFALQYIMALIATMDSQEYFARNDKLKSYIEGYNETFPQAVDLQGRLLAVVRFLKNLRLPRDTRWYKKANLFTLLVELDKVELDEIDPGKLAGILSDLDTRATLDELGVDENKLSQDELKYLAYAREAVNQRAAREFRGSFVRGLIDNSQKDVPGP
jgi:hypothetical protein